MEDEDGGRWTRRRVVVRWATALEVVAVLAFFGLNMVDPGRDDSVARAQAALPALPDGPTGSSSAPPAGPATSAAAASTWVRTWHAAQQAPQPGSAAARGIGNRTVRMRIRSTVGGAAVRVTLSNLYGAAPLRVLGVSVGLPAVDGGTDPGVRPGTLRALGFAGAAGVTLSAAGSVLSDPAAVTLPARADVMVSVALAGPPAALTGHQYAAATSWVSAPGDHTGESAGTPFTGRETSTVVLAAVDVAADVAAPGDAPPVVVCFGDSITDGVRSTFDADRRWPDLLADRLPGVAVVNAGISGNRVLVGAPGYGDAAGTRFDRDALDVPGASVVVVLEGINDIQHGAGAEQLVAGLAGLADRARDRGLRVVLSTIAPYAGRASWTPSGERTRQAVNAWVRSRAVAEGHADAVADVDAALHSPGDPTRLAPGLDSGDRLHPGDAGYAAVAAAAEAAVRGLLPAG